MHQIILYIGAPLSVTASFLSLNMKIIFVYPTVQCRHIRAVFMN